MQIFKVPIDELKPNPWNARKQTPAELKALGLSIKERGQVKPIAVRELPKGGYEIIGGFHTWLAMKESGAKEIFIINEGKLSDKDAKLRGLQDNLHGQDAPLELAMVLADLQKEGLTLAKIAEKIGKPKFEVEDILRVLQDQDKVKDLEDDLNKPHLVEVSFILDDDAGLNEALKRLESKLLAELGKLGADQIKLKTTKNAKRESVNVLSVWVVAPARAVIDKALETIMAESECKRGRALELLCADYLSGAKIDDKEKKKKAKA